MKLYEHQEKALEACEGRNRVAFYHDMGLGKTYTGSEKMELLGGHYNLVICQKSKVIDWVAHFKDNYPDYQVYDLTKSKDFQSFWMTGLHDKFLLKYYVCVINYDLIWRRGELHSIHWDTLMLDESSMIQNETAKRTKAIMKLKTDNVILLSGTPTGGKYEKLYSQLKLLGMPMNKKEYYDTFVETYQMPMGRFSVPIVCGYKNIGKLKRMMRRLGCQFLKTEEVLTLPSQTFSEIGIAPPKEYKKFVKNHLVTVDEHELVGDNSLKQMLGERQLCGQYCSEKYQAFSDLLDSTEDRLIVFYNFNEEYKRLAEICEKRKRTISYVNGHARDLDAYEEDASSVTFIQYQAGAMGLNLQKANKIVYFSPTLSSELYEQSKKRTHRIGQEKPCFYWNMICRGTVEEDIYAALSMRHDYTEQLFAKGGRT